MQQCFLYRTDTSDEGTFGVLIHPHGYLFTGELPWRDNRTSVSCIPAGEYQVDYTWSPLFKRFTYEVQNVPNRSGIRLHSGNYCCAAPVHRADVLGCILLGKARGYLSNQKVVLYSKPAVTSFETAMGKKAFKLTIG